MLIRFMVKNLFSFKEETEFNLLPSKDTKLAHHKYQHNGVEVLKSTAIYGANGSGKSNLIKAIGLLKQLLISGNIPAPFYTQKFRLSPKMQQEPVEMSIDFMLDKNYYYAISINQGIILDEYLCITEKDKEDVLIFHRKQKGKKISIEFSKEFYILKENVVLKKLIENTLLKSDKPLFTFLNQLNLLIFTDVENAYSWFKSNLSPLFRTHLNSYANYADKQNTFIKNFISTFNTGITDLKVEKQSIEDFFGQDDLGEINKIKEEFITKKVSSITKRHKSKDVMYILEDEKIVVKTLTFIQKDDEGKDIEFKINELSDGTRLLISYVPFFQYLLNKKCTVLIDEIELSIHPNLIKELLTRFSKNEETKGQLIFSTHDTNLLDQKIFRTDEIWFAEKNEIGATKLYSLSEYKQNSSIDIEEGYLQGRYGAIPFLGGLQNDNNKENNEQNYKQKSDNYEET